MAFPTIDNIRQSQQTSNTETDQPIVLNATIAAGDLVIIVGTTDDDDAVTWDDSSHGTWTEFQNGSGTTQMQALIYAQKMAGTESGGTITPTTALGEKSAFTCIRILAAEWEGSSVANAVTVAVDAPTGDTTTPDPVAVM